jgi:hypothetical protein
MGTIFRHLGSGVPATLPKTTFHHASDQGGWFGRNTGGADRKEWGGWPKELGGLTEAFGHSETRDTMQHNGLSTITFA